MSSATETHKHIPVPEKNVALAAIATAQRRHAHVGLRPKRERGQDRRSEAIEIKRSLQAGRNFEYAMRKAAAAWPKDQSWEIVGADNYCEPTDEDEWSLEDATCWLDSPTIYGEFDSTDMNDRPGWMG